MITRRSAFGVFAASLLAPIALHAQPGGLPSSTAPSNSQGTPSGGTGIVGTSQVGPTTTTAPVRHRRRTTHKHRTTSAK